jgi:Siphovirus protein of unknown function (DUF859)
LALSGSFGSNINEHWRIQCDWTASQSISGNYSNVTMKTYWISKSQYGTTYTSDTKSGSATINGSSGSFSFSAKLSGTEKKLVNTRTVRVNHNSDGSKSISLSAYLDIELTLKSTYYGRISTSESVTLNDIPRASSISSGANFTAGSNLAISVSRANGGFTHVARVYVNGVNVYTTPSGSKFGTSVTASINHTEVFNQLGGSATKAVRVEVDTYSGSTLVGKTGDSGMPPDKTGTVTAPSASKASINGTIGGDGSTVYFDQTISVSISRAISGFTHTVRFKDGNSGAIIKEFTGVGTSVSWTPNATEQAQIYNKIPTSNELDGQIDVYTYYSGKLVRSMTDKDINYRIRNANPTFGTGNISYEDANATTKALTGDMSFIIQNYSTLRVKLNSLATAKLGASIVRYDINVGGKPDSLTAVGYKDMGTINASADTPLKVEAVDSRGNRTSATLNVKMIPYAPPVAIVSAKRNNNFEDTTVVKVSGTISPITVGATQKNKLKTGTYTYKITTASTYPTAISLGTMPTTASFSFADKTLTLNNLSSYHVQIAISDQLSTTTVTKTVSTGQPIVFIDSDKKSMGVNRFPLGSNMLEVQGGMLLENNGFTDFTISSTSAGRDPILSLKSTTGTWALLNDDSDSSSFQMRYNNTAMFTLNKNNGTMYTKRFQPDPNQYVINNTFGIDMANSDIVGINGIFTNDAANSDAEAINWMKPNGTVGNYSDLSKFDSFRVYDGSGFLNSKPIFTSDNEILWSGYVFLRDDHNVVPSKKLSECPNGWILFWSHYDGGVFNYDWNFTVVHKRFGDLTGGGFHAIIKTRSDGIVTKYCYATNTTLTGLAGNGTGAQATQALRYILSF